MQAFKETNFRFEGQSAFYRGKVRDIYFFGEKMVVVATDRISAFDTIFPYAIPDKGRVLNQIAARHLRATDDIIPNWTTAHPDPNVTVGFKCDVFPVEMVVRGYLAGHAWREYKQGKRTLCGVAMPEGLRENDPFPNPIITPTTKALQGKDRDITKEEIIDRKLVGGADYVLLEQYALQLYKRGSELAADRGLILVDTKYEFGKRNNTLYLVDEIHTPDSSRYFYRQGYRERQKEGRPQQHLSKEFVRQWSIANGFQGKQGQPIPEMTDGDIRSISNRYRELYERIMGQPIDSISYEDITERIEKNIVNFMF